MADYDAKSGSDELGAGDWGDLGYLDCAGVYYAFGGG